MIPLLSQLFTAFLGDAQSQNPIMLSNAYSSSGSVNLYIDKLGQIRPIDGFLRQNAAAFTTDTGGSAAMVRSLYMYRRIAAGATTRQLLFVLDDGINEYELYYSTDLGVTKTLIVDLGLSAIGTIPDFATFGDQLFVTFGATVVPRYWDGTSLANTGVTQLGAPTLADAGAGQLNGSGYKYRLIPIRANKERKPGSVSSAALDVQNRRITISWTADSDGTVVGYELYRTTGSGLDFYLVAYVDGRTTATYVGDTVPDSELITRPALSVVASHGDSPPTGAFFCVPHKGRMWWGRTQDLPRRWWWSDPGDADSVYQDRSYTECTDSKSLGDSGTGGTGDFEGMIVLWFEQSVWTISGTGMVLGGEIDWRKRRSNARTGTVWHRTVARVPKGAVYTDQDGQQRTTDKNTLAYLTPQKDIRLFDGQNDTLISYSKSVTLARMLTNPDHARKSYVYEDTQHGMFCWVFPIDDSIEPNYTVAWNYVYGTWHEWSGTNFGHVTTAQTVFEQNILIAGQALVATGAFLYKLWTGNTQDGASITATLMTKPLFPPLEQSLLPDFSHEKRLESIFLMFAKDASPTNGTLGILPWDAVDSATPTISRVISASSRVRVPARMPDSETNPGKFFYGVGYRLKFTSTVTSGPWTLQAIETLYQPLKGQSR